MLKSYKTAGENAAGYKKSNKNSGLAVLSILADGLLRIYIET
ncbi:hypothetical protein [Halioxenophilus aromaticivorans]